MRTRCGGGGGGGGAATASGTLVVKDTRLYVVNAASQAAVDYAGTSTTNIPGVSVSRSGLIGDLWDCFGGGSSWKVTIRSLTNASIAEYDIGGLLAFPSSAAVLNADGKWLAFLRSGAVAGKYLAVIPFAANATRAISDADELRSPSGSGGYPGSGRFGWAR